MKDLPLREELIRHSRAIRSRELGVGKAGNLSARVAGGFIITPTGMDYDLLEPADIVTLDPEGKPTEGRRTPSSEWRIHRDIYMHREEAGAVVHVHSPYATALACSRRQVPAFHYMVAVAGGDSIRCADYATFGSQELSDNTLQALDERAACLLANHGMIAMGRDLPAAFAMAVQVEDLCRQYALACRFGEPVCLDESEMRTILEKYKSYGRQS